MKRKTLYAEVRPIYGARMGLSVLYLYRGKRLGAYTCLNFWQAESLAALSFAREHGFSGVRFSVSDDFYREPREYSRKCSNPMEGI